MWVICDYHYDWLSIVKPGIIGLKQLWNDDDGGAINNLLFMNNKVGFARQARKTLWSLRLIVKIFIPKVTLAERSVLLLLINL